MARKKKLPWLDYAGQDTAEILACKSTHRIDSLLHALEAALQLRQGRNPAIAATPEEYALLAILALEREVNNGGYHQFFLNSSSQYALTVVDALRKVGCDATAALTEEAIHTLNQRPLTLEAIRSSIRKPNRERDRVLNALGQRFYKILEIEPKLFTFVESHPRAFAIEKMHVAPRPPERGNRNLIKLEVGLMLSPKPERTLDAVRRLAAEIAIREEIEPTEMELDGAVYLFLFESFLKDGDLEQCESFAGHAFDLARENTSHCVTQRQWVEKLIERSNFVRADEVTLQYLEYLRSDDTTHRFIKNRITWWADPLRRNGAELPKSSAYFRANFPEVNLDQPPAPRFHGIVRVKKA
jgi:hypothetical protein